MSRHGDDQPHVHCIPIDEGIKGLGAILNSPMGVAMIAQAEAKFGRAPAVFRLMALLDDIPDVLQLMDKYKVRLNIHVELCVGTPDLVPQGTMLFRPNNPDSFFANDSHT